MLLPAAGLTRLLSAWLVLSVTLLAAHSTSQQLLPAVLRLRGSGACLVLPCGGYYERAKAVRDASPESMLHVEVTEDSAEDSATSVMLPESDTAPPAPGSCSEPYHAPRSRRFDVGAFLQGGAKEAHEGSTPSARGSEHERLVVQLLGGDAGGGVGAARRRGADPVWMTDTRARLAECAAAASAEESAESMEDEGAGSGGGSEEPNGQGETMHHGQTGETQHAEKSLDRMAMGHNKDTVRQRKDRAQRATTQLVINDRWTVCV